MRFFMCRTFSTKKKSTNVSCWTSQRKSIPPRPNLPPKSISKRHGLNGNKKSRIHRNELSPCLMWKAFRLPNSRTTKSRKNQPSLKLKRSLWLLRQFRLYQQARRRAKENPGAGAEAAGVDGVARVRTSLSLL